MGLWRNAQGDVVDVPDDYAARQPGYEKVSSGEEAQIADVEGAKLRQANVAEGAVPTFIRGVGGGLTLGATDALTGAMASDAQRESVLAGEAEHPIARGAGEVGGMLAGAFAAPASALGRTPAGYLARAGGEAFEAGVARGGIAGTAQAIGAAGAEGAIQNAGMYLGHAALEDKELTAEGLSGALGTGFAFGAIGGGAALGVEKGTIAARRMFSRVMDGGKNAAVDAEVAWQRASQDVLDADAATYKAAKQELEDLRTARREAEVEKARADAAVAGEKARAGRVPDEGTAVPTKGVNESYLTPEAGPAGETQVAQTSSAVPKPNEVAYDEAVRNVSQGETKVEKAPASEATKVSKGPLEKNLQDMASRAEAGQSLGEMRAAAPDTAARLGNAERNRAAMQNIDEAFGFKNPLGNDFAKREAELVEATSAMEAALVKLPDVDVQTLGKFNIPTRGEGVGPGDVPLEFASGTSPGRRPLSNEDWKVLAKGTPVDKAGLDAAIEASYEKAANATTAVEREAALNEARKFEQQLGEESIRSGKNAVTDVARKAEDVTAYEKASKKLTETMGDRAHPVSQEFAKGVSKAEDEAARRMLDRTTRAAEDAEMNGPTRLSSKDRVAAAKQYKLESTAELKGARAREAQANAKVEALPKPAKPVKGARPSKEERLGKLGGIEALAQANEIADIPGLPKLHDLPVVGPLLSAWVKFKAVKGALGRFAGRVPATADARAAALAARVKDRIATSVDRALGLAEKVAVKGRQPAINIAAAVSRRIYDDGGPDAAEGAPTTEKVAVRVRELAAYVNTPGAIERDVRREMKDVADPDLIAAAEAHQRAVNQHLLDTAPLPPPPDPLNKREYAPSPAEAIKWARRLAVAHNPVSVFESMEAGTITVEQAETLREAYPRLFALAQQRVLERAADLQGPLSHRSRTMMSILFDAPLDRALAPESLSVVQSVYGAPNAPAPPPMGASPPSPSIAAGVNLTPLFQTAADRSAAAR